MRHCLGADMARKNSKGAGETGISSARGIRKHAAENRNHDRKSTFQVPLVE